MKIAARITAALAFSALSGCYVVSGPDGQLWHVVPGYTGGPAAVFVNERPIPFLRDNRDF